MWQTDVCASYASPIITDKFVFFNDYDQWLYCFDKNSGSLLKRQRFYPYPWHPGDPLPMPLVFNPASVYADKIFFSRVDCRMDFSSPYPDEKDTGYLIVIDTETYTELWRKEIGLAGSPPVVFGDTIYVTGAKYHGGPMGDGELEGYVWALDIITGQEIWEFAIDDYANLSIGGGLLYVTFFNQKSMFALDLYAPACPWDGKVELNGYPYSPVVPVSDKIFVSCLDYVRGLDKSATKQQTRILSPSFVQSFKTQQEPTTNTAIVVITEAQHSKGDVSQDGKITAHDAKLVMQYVIGQIQLTTEQKELADVSGNGTISAYDAGLIMQMCTGVKK